MERFWKEKVLTVCSFEGTNVRDHHESDDLFFGKIHDILTEVRKLENYDNGKEESEEDKK